MALHYSESFDKFRTMSDLQTFGGWTFEGSVPATEADYISDGGRFGGGCIALYDVTQTSYLRRQCTTTAAAAGTACLGFAFKSASATFPSQITILGGMNTFGATNDNPGGTNFQGFTIYIEASGEVNLGFYGDNTPNSFPFGKTNVCDGQWHWIEIAVKNDNSTGLVTLNVDGVQEREFNGDTFVFSGSASAVIDGFVFRAGPTQQSTWYIDDIIWYDSQAAVTTGDLTYATDYPLGDLRIDRLRPNGAGTNAGWTSSGGANYAAVDDAVPNGDYDYVEVASSALTDSYAFTNPSATVATCHAVMVGALSRNNAGVTQSFKPIAISSETTTEAATITPGATYSYTQVNIPLDPATSSAWTGSGINAAEFGIDSQ